MKKSKTPKTAFPDRDDRIEDLWSHLAKTSDLATVISIAAHGAQNKSATIDCLSAIESAADIVSDRIMDAIEELETIWKAPDSETTKNRRRIA